MKKTNDCTIAAVNLILICEVTVKSLGCPKVATSFVGIFDQVREFGSFILTNNGCPTRTFVDNKPINTIIVKKIDPSLQGTFSDI